MVPTKKEELRNLVTQTTMETYEELTPHLVQLINETNRNPELTEAQKQDEISLHMMGFVKSCTNEIIIEVLGEIVCDVRKMSEISLTKKVHGVKLRDIKARALRKNHFEALFLLYKRIAQGCVHFRESTTEVHTLFRYRTSEG